MVSENCVYKTKDLIIISGSCPNNSRELSDENLNFMQTHPLMDEAVPPFLGTPVLTRTGIHSGFTSIDVVAQVTTTDGNKYDVIFVGTSTGQLSQTQSRAGRLSSLD